MATWRNRVLGMSLVGLAGLALVAGPAQGRDDDKAKSDKPKAAAPAPRGIIANLDLKEATLQGSWTIEGRELVSTIGNKPAAIRVGDMHAGEYTLKFSAKRTKGTGGLILGFFAGDARGDVVIEGWDDKISGISSIAGKAGNENETKKELDLFAPKGEGQSESGWVPFTLRVDAKSVRLTSDGNPVIVWAGDRTQLASPSNLASDLGGIYLLVQSTSDQFRIKDLDLDAIEKPVAKKPVEPKPKRDADAGKDSGLELPASGSKWFGNRTPDQGGNPMQVDATVDSVGEDEFVMTTVDGGNAAWQWKFVRKGNKLTELKSKRLVRAPNGAGRDVTTTNDRAWGTISKDGIKIQYSWNVTFRKMKNQPVSGSMELKPE